MGDMHPIEDFQRGGQGLHEHRVGVGDRVGHAVEVGDRQGQVGGQRAVQVEDAQHAAVGAVAGVAPAAGRARPAGDVDLPDHPRPSQAGSPGHASTTPANSWPSTPAKPL